MTFTSPLIGSLLAQRRAIYAALAALIVFGALSLPSLPQSVYPHLTFSRINVHAENADLPPELVQTSIGLPLQQALESVLGVREVTVDSTQGATNLYASFDPQTAPSDIALQRVAVAVAAAQGHLPPGTTLQINPVGTNLYPVLSYALTSSHMNQMALREWAEYQAKPQLLGLPGVSYVNVLGGAVREYRVTYHPQALAARGVTLDQLTQAISRTNTIQSVGHQDQWDIRHELLASGLAFSSAQIAQIPIAAPGSVPVTVGDVATVAQAPAPVTWHAGQGAQDAVILNVYPQPSASFVQISTEVQGALRQTLAAAPDVHAAKFWDQSTLVSGAIRSLRDAILVGLALSTLVLLVFLRSWRETVIAAIIIPLTILVAFGYMRLAGHGLNLATLGGLAVGVGLIIDDAIVVVESIHRHLASGEERQAAIEAAVSEIAAPMISSTLTTIVVFVPLSVVSGVPGAFFRSLSATLTVALLLSLLLALAFTPGLALALLPTSPRKTDDVQPHPGRAMQAYDRALRGALRHKALMWAAAAGLLAVTVWLGSHLGSDFLPTLDEGALEMNIAFPPGTSLGETVRVSRQMAQAVNADPAVAGSAVLTGKTFGLLTDTSLGQNMTVIRATLKPQGQRPPVDSVITHLEQKVAQFAPNAQVSAKQLLQDMLDELSDVPAPIEVRLYGPDQSVLIPLASQIASRIARVPGVSGAFSGVTHENPGVVLEARPGASRWGVTPQDLAQTEAALFDGQVVSSVLRGPLSIPIRVRSDLPLSPDPAQVQNAPYVTPTGAVVPLSTLAAFIPAPPQSDVSARNGRQYLSITAQTLGSNLGTIRRGIARQIAHVSLPPGYSVEIAGSYALQKKAFAQILLAVSFSVILVLLVLLVQFRSFVQPLVILTAIPLALFGAALLLWITGITLNVSSLMGVILLVGLVVKNGILLLEYTVRLERDGWSVEDALAAAARIRLRPIMMTTLTALLGMLPLALDWGAGSAMLQPLAVATIGGLLFSTLATLGLMPVFYATFRRAARSARISVRHGDAPM